MSHSLTDRLLSRLRLKQLQLLVAVGKHGSILHAAREMNLSQPAATKMIKDLELDFEVPLFDRGNRGVTPTPFGIALIRQSKLIFAQVSNASQEINDLAKGNSGRVVVGTLLAASQKLLPTAIATTLKTRPNVTIRVVDGTHEILMPALRMGELDMVVGRLPTHRYRNELAQITLFSEETILLTGAGHPLANHPVNFDDLRHFGWILPPAETTLRRQIDQFFARQDGFTPKTIVESVSFLTNRSLLQSTELIGIMPAHAATQDIANGTLVRLGFPLPFGPAPVGVSYHKTTGMTPAATAFLQALKQAVQS